MGHPGLFLIYFCLFKHTLQFLQQINVIKCPSSIQCWDSNPQPLEHESPPITTRPGIPHKGNLDFLRKKSFITSTAAGDADLRSREYFIRGAAVVECAFLPLKQNCSKG